MARSPSPSIAKRGSNFPRHSEPQRNPRNEPQRTQRGRAATKRAGRTAEILEMYENEISGEIIGAAIEVHREIGPGPIEKPYEEAMCHELPLRGLAFVRQRSVAFCYKGVRLSTDLRTDLIVGDPVIVAFKANEQVTAIDRMKVLT